MIRAGRSRCRRLKPGTGSSLKEDRKSALLILEFFVFFSEPLDASRGVDQLLLTGEKRVAFGANFHAYVFFCRTNLNNAAAGTLNGCVEIIRMDIGFHCIINPL